MARQRARDAFAWVGTAQVAPIASDSASISASNNAGELAIPSDSTTAIRLASTSAGITANSPATSRAGGRAPPSGGAEKQRRRLGRPRSPARVALSIRILAANDARLTATVESTGQSPQYVVDAALAAYFDGLGIPAAEPGGVAAQCSRSERGLVRSLPPSSPSSAYPPAFTRVLTGLVAGSKVRSAGRG
jgi:hypothetical protein